LSDQTRFKSVESFKNLFAIRLPLIPIPTRQKEEELGKKAVQSCPESLEGKAAICEGDEAYTGGYVEPSEQ